MKKYNKIQLTQQDFLNIENAFHFFVDNCNLTQKEQDSIIFTLNVQLAFVRNSFSNTSKT